MGNCFGRHGRQYAMQSEVEYNANDPIDNSAQSVVIGTPVLASAQFPVPQTFELESANGEENRANDQNVNSAQSALTGIMELAPGNSEQCHVHEHNQQQSAVTGIVEYFPANGFQDQYHDRDESVNLLTTVTGTEEPALLVNEENIVECTPLDSTLNQKLGQPYGTNTYHSDKIELIWTSPQPLAIEEAFQISYRENKGKWKTVDTLTKENIFIISGLKAQTTYNFRVRTINDTTGEEGQYSMKSDDIPTGKSPALEIKQKSSLIDNSTPPVYKLPITEDITARNTSAKTRKFVLGMHYNSLSHSFREQ